MADNTIIQIKRSTTTANPTDLQPGELAYTSNGEVLFIGSVAGSNTANVIAIGGQRNPGVLTANQALVANTSSWIDNVQTAKLIIGTAGETANITAFSTDGGFGGANVSNSTIASTWAIKNYIDTQAGSSTLGGLSDVTITTPSNNQIVVYDATAGQWENHSINGTTNEVDVTFSGQDITIGLPNDVTVSANLTVTNGLSTNVAAVTNTTESSNTTTGALTVAGGLGVAKKINSAELAVGNTSVYTSANGSAISTGNVYATGTVNGAVLSVGGWVIANQSGVFTSGVVNGDILSVGSNFIANTTQVTVAVPLQTNNITATGTVNATAGFNAGANVNITVSDINIGNSSVNTFANSSTIRTGTLSVADITATGNLNVQGTLLADGNVVLGNNSADNISVIGSVNTHILPAANVTYDLGSQNLQWREMHANNGHFEYLTIDHDVSVAGNLTVTGSLVTINVSTLSVIDPLIQLASNNTVSDTVDIGFFGSYSDGVGAHEHAGLFRDATDGVFKLFKGLEPAPGITVDTSNNTYAVATLEAYFTSSGLVTNATTVAITANSTVNVAIVANTLTLSSALTVPNGGTGQTTFANNGVLLGNTAGALSVATAGSNGQVLKVVGGVPQFAHLDGGTF